MKLFDHQITRFILVGSLNTFIGYGLYLLFNLVADYRLAYTISYLCGILIGFLLNSLLVFRQPLRWKALVLYPMVYILQYVLGLFLLWISVSFFFMPETYAPLLVVVLTLPVTFLASRAILGKRSHATPQH